MSGSDDNSDNDVRDYAEDDFEEPSAFDFENSDVPLSYLVQRRNQKAGGGDIAALPPLPDGPNTRRKAAATPSVSSLPRRANTGLPNLRIKTDPRFDTKDTRKLYLEDVNSGGSSVTVLTLKAARKLLGENVEVVGPISPDAPITHFQGKHYGLYWESIRAGLRSPLSPFHQSVLQYYSVHPG